MNTIRFYKPTEPYGEFSNFSDHPVKIDGKTWPTTEHYFQAQKFKDTQYEEKIRLLSSPMEAMIAGQDKNKPLRKDWEQVKVDVMRTAIKAKFTQYDDLKQLLKSTQTSFLVEHTSNDSYWADGGNGRGRNMLGQILMEVRQQLDSI
ncbi:MAG: NADAR family protein [Bermanella sp.]